MISSRNHQRRTREAYSMADYPDNEPILSYAPGSMERVELQEEMDRQMRELDRVFSQSGGPHHHFSYH